MNKLQINNLRTLIDNGYPHICVNIYDLQQFLNIPWEAKRYYPMSKYRRGNWYDKHGFFNNGKTTVWATLSMKPNHIKIADKETPTVANGAYWSMEFSFENEGSPNIIRKMMKLKAFW